MECAGAEELQHDIGDVCPERSEDVAHLFGGIGQIVSREAEQHEKKHDAECDERHGHAKSISFRFWLHSSSIMRRNE